MWRSSHELLPAQEILLYVDEADPAQSEQELTRSAVNRSHELYSEKLHEACSFYWRDTVCIY